MYDFNIYGGFSARPAYQIKLYVRRDITDVANNRSSYAWALYAEKISSGTTWTADQQPWYVQVGPDNFSGTHSLDFRSTNSILLASNTTNYFNHDGNGYLNIGLAASVVAAGSSLFGNASASGTFPTDRIARPPAAPTAQGVESITTNSMVFRFYGNSDNGSAITGWRIERSLSPSFTSPHVTNNAPNNGVVGATGLDDDTTYYFRVRGSNAVGDSGWSGTVSGKTLLADTVPDAPTAMGITNKSWDRFTFQFNDNGNGGTPITSHRLEVSTSSSFTSPIVVTNPGFSHVVTGLAGNTKYYARVRATNAIGNSAWSGTVSATTTATPTAPGPPVLTGLSNIGPDSITVTYTARDNGGSNITSGQMQYATNAGFSGATDIGGTGSPRVVTGLEDGTEYWFRFRVTNAWGTSGWSNILSASTLSAVLVGKSGEFEYTTVYVGKNGGWVAAEVFVGSGGSFVSPT